LIFEHLFHFQTARLRHPAAPCTQGQRFRVNERNPKEEISMHAAGSVSGVADKVVMRGRITIENSGEIRWALSRALRIKPAKLTVDLSNV
jgi:hypothetical protein